MVETKTFHVDQAGPELLVIIPVSVSLEIGLKVCVTLCPATPDFHVGYQLKDKSRQSQALLSMAVYSGLQLRAILLTFSPWDVGWPGLLVLLNFMNP